VQKVHGRRHQESDGHGEEQQSQSMDKLTQEQIPGIPENDPNTDNTDEYISRALPVHPLHNRLSSSMYISNNVLAVTIVTGFRKKHNREISLLWREKRRA
jgi:hypothetical protein